MRAAVAIIAGWLPRSDAGRNVLTLAFGQACGHVLLLAATPLLTRLYGPETFGLFATYHAIVVIGSVVTTLRYEVAIPLAEGRRGAWHLLYLSLGLAVLVAGLAGAVFLLLRDWGLPYLQAPELRSFAIVAALNIAGYGGYQAATYYLLRERAFKQLAAVRVVLSLVTVCGQLGLAVMLAGPAGLILGHFIGYSAACILLAALVFNRRGAPGVSLVEVRSVAVRFKRFPQLSVWGALVGILVVLLPTLLVAAMFGPLSAGWYLLAHRCSSFHPSTPHAQRRDEERER